MFDLHVIGMFDFDAPKVTVEARSDAGRAFLGEMFGEGAVSVEMPKTKGEDFRRFSEQKGLSALLV